MSLIIATGSNLGKRQQHLYQALDELTNIFKLIASSNIYSSEAVDYIDQPSFYNQVLEFKEPSLKPTEILDICLQVEAKMGRVRTIRRGPRIIDIDIIFIGKQIINLPKLTIPHKSWKTRSFVVKPLSELPFFEIIKKDYQIPQSFSVDASPIKTM